MNFTVAQVIPADHPSLAGHFPGNPIVPGVVILEEVCAALAQRVGHCKLQAIPSVKFIAPLRPGQAFAIHLSVEDQQVKFRCTVGEQLIAQGQLHIACR